MSTLQVVTCVLVYFVYHTEIIQNGKGSSPWIDMKDIQGELIEKKKKKNQGIVYAMGYILC